MSSTTQTSADANVGEAGTASEESITRSELFHVLRNQRRRFAIHHLKREDGTVTVGELATQVAAWENGVREQEVTSKQRRRVYNALQQTHLPELQETGLVTRERREIELTQQAEQIDIYLEVVPGKAVPWSEYYLALGGVSVTLLTTVGLDIGPFAAILDISVGVFCSVALLMSAGAHYYQNASLLGQPDLPPELRGD